MKYTVNGNKADVEVSGIRNRCRSTVHILQVENEVDGKVGVRSGEGNNVEFNQI